MLSETVSDGCFAHVSRPCQRIKHKFNFLERVFFQKAKRSETDVGESSAYSPPEGGAAVGRPRKSTCSSSYAGSRTPSPLLSVSVSRSFQTMSSPLPSGSSQLCSLRSPLLFVSYCDPFQRWVAGVPSSFQTSNRGGLLQSD